MSLPICQRPGVDIVVPIHNARQFVQECIASVLRYVEGDYRLVLVDDASTDRELVSWLEDLARLNSRAVLLQCEVNGGFVQAANRGLRHAAGRDVLLLNSDTIATAGFLSRLQDCAYADEATGIVTPFSNNATICSIPRFCQDNPLPEGISLDEYAELISRCSLKSRPEIVTAVGFCMYIKAAVLDAIGCFDPCYGRGFGEENDFCERAKAHGFEIRLCDDVFIAHRGKASFGKEGNLLERGNMKVLLGRFPSYLRQVADFCATNPLLEVQQNITYHLRRREAVEFAAPLFLIHADPFRADAGGVEHHVLDLMNAAKFPRALLAYPQNGGLVAAEVLRGETRDPLLHWYPLSGGLDRILLDHPKAVEATEEILDCFGVDLVHIHHLFNWPVRIWRVFARRKIPFFFTVHDFYCACPSHNLFDYDRRSRCTCDLEEPATTRCLRAYERHAGLQLPRADAEGVRRHRQEFAELLATADTVLFPSRRAFDIVSGRYPALQFRSAVIPHGVPARAAASFPGRNHGPLRVAILGSVHHVLKGAENYLEIIGLTREAAVEWHFFGDIGGFDFQGRVSSVCRAEKLVFHGFYHRDRVLELLSYHKIELVLLAPAVDETFSFILSEALCARVPVLALRMGSLEERLRDAGFSDWVVDSPAEAARRILVLVSDRRDLEDARDRLRAFRHPDTTESAQHILEAYGPAAKALSTPSEPLSFERQARCFRAYWRASRNCGQKQVAIQWVEDGPGPRWYRAALRLQHFVPLSFQRTLRTYLMGKHWELLAVHTFPSRSRAVQVSADVEPSGCLRVSGRLRSIGTDPYLILPAESIESARVHVLRLRMRCRTDQPARAQLFWVHSNDENFSERKSLIIPLKHSEKWQDIVIEIAKSPVGAQWTAGAHVVRLRLDPLDCPGTFELDSLYLAGLREMRR